MSSFVVIVRRQRPMRVNRLLFFSLVPRFSCLRLFDAFVFFLFAFSFLRNVLCLVSCRLSDRGVAEKAEQGTREGTKRQRKTKSVFLLFFAAAIQSINQSINPYLNRKRKKHKYFSFPPLSLSPGWPLPCRDAPSTLRAFPLDRLPPARPSGTTGSGGRSATSPWRRRSPRPGRRRQRRGRSATPPGTRPLPGRLCGRGRKGREGRPRRACLRSAGERTRRATDRSMPLRRFFFFYFNGFFFDRRFFAFSERKKKKGCCVFFRLFVLSRLYCRRNVLPANASRALDRRGG